MSVQVRWCSACRQRAHLDTSELCERCEWLQAIGVLVDTAIGVLVDTASPWDLSALDAVAYILRERAVTRRSHQRQLFEEQREQQRAARDGYHQGREDEFESRRSF